MQNFAYKENTAEYAVSVLTEEQCANIDAMSGYVVAIDQNGNIIYSNDNWNQYIFHNTPKNTPIEFLNNYFQLGRCCKNTDAYQAFKGIMSVINGELINFELDFTCQISKKHFQMHVSPINENTETCAAVISHSEIKPKGETTPYLPTAEKCYQALFDSFSEGVMVVDLPCGTIRRCNKALTEFTGYSAKELQGKTFWSITPEKWHGYERSLVLEQLGIQNHTGEFEKEYVRKDGEIIPISLQCWPLRNEAGNVIAAWAIIKDLSNHKRKELALKQNQKLELLGTLAGGISHEFNNVLSIILANAEMLKACSLGQNTDSDHINSVIKATERATKMVQQLQTFSLLGTFSLAVTDLTTIVDSAVGLIATNLRENIKITKNISATPLLAMASDTQIQQVVINLCNNAIQELEESGGNIHVSLQPLKEPVYENPHLRLSVSDTGNGIDMNSVSQMFEPFYTTKPAGKGCGLGLSVVHGIVNRHAGKIYVENTNQAGANFHIDIPLYQPELSH